MRDEPTTGPVIETERLLLRPPTLDDFDRWADMMADADSARFIGGVMTKPVAWRGVMQVRGAWVLTGVSMFSVIDKARNVWIGRVGPWQPYGWPGTEVGWGLHPDAWGKGYALEAAIASIDYALDTLGWTEVIHCIDPENVRSQALARRLGSTHLRDAKMPPPFEAVVEVWGQTRDDWMKNRSLIAGLGAPRRK